VKKVQQSTELLEDDITGCRNASEW